MAGPFYFAWVSDAETTFNASHVREDEQVIDFDLVHSEGDLPSLVVTILNPRVGFLAPGRDRWCWFSYNPGWVSGESESESDLESEDESENEFAQVTPLFFGRLVAMPDNIQAETISLEFLARPVDFYQQKLAVAATMKEAPFYDPVFFSQDVIEDPDNVLEARPELWHVDRITHVVTTSDILTGDEVIDIDQGEAFYDSVEQSYGSPPFRKVEINADISWSQNATDTFNISEYFTTQGNGHSIQTFTGQGVLDNWPKVGARYGCWTVVDASVVRFDGTIHPEWGYYRIGAHNAEDLDTFQRNFAFLQAYVPPWYRQDRWEEFGYPFPSRLLRVYEWWMKPTVVVRYDVSRNRSEKLRLTLEADVQAVVAEPGDDEVLTLGYTSSEIALPIDPPAESGSDAQQLPIREVRNGTYFATERGAQSIEFLIAIARARLIAASRAVLIDFDIPFNLGVALDLSCRKSLLLHDDRLPGGQAAGKIVSYSLSGSGESGELKCHIQIGCCIGRGGSVGAIEGTPTYCESDYVGNDYQFYAGKYVMPIAGEVAYESQLGLPGTDDGVNFALLTKNSIVKTFTRTGTPAEQRAAIGEGEADPNTLFQKLDAVPTTFEVVLKDLTGGPFETLYDVNTTLLKLPKTIDLEAV